MLKNGKWRITERYSTLQEANNGRTMEVFKKYLPQDIQQESRIISLVKAMLNLMFRLTVLEVTGLNKTAHATVAYITREQEFKLFSEEEGRVFTSTTLSKWKSLESKTQSKIFQHFKTPVKKLIKTNSHYFIDEQLSSAPAIGLLDFSQQKKAMDKMFVNYYEYIVADSKLPKPEIILDAYNEVKEYLPLSIQSHYTSYASAVEDFASRCFFIDAHLDFNVANILFDGEITLLDIADSGLCVPCLFDVNNLALNELYENRDTHLLKYLLQAGTQPSYQALMSAALLHPKDTDQRISLFVNFVMRESSYVSMRLIGSGPNTNRIERHWKRFRENIPRW